MDGFLYPVSLFIVALVAIGFYRSNNARMMLLALAVGVYIIYSHETGNTATNFKNEVIESIDESTRDFSKSRGVEGFDESKAAKAVK